MTAADFDRIVKTVHLQILLLGLVYLLGQNFLWIQAYLVLQVDRAVPIHHARPTKDYYYIIII